MIQKRALLIAAMVIAILAFGGVAVAATAITVGDGWHGFGTGDNSQPYPQSPFTFTATDTVVLTITDVLCPGDRYSISVGSNTIGTTSVPGSSDCAYVGYTADPDVALADPNYSHGRWALGAATYSIDVALFFSPFPASGGAIRFDQLTADMCSNGGWASIAPFRSEGQCVGAIRSGVVGGTVHIEVKKFH